MKKRKKVLRFGDKKNDQPTLIAIREAEKNPRAKLSKEADYRGFDLGKTGTIRSLLNFIATATYKPRTKRTKKGLYLRLDDTGDFWLENLRSECNDPRNSEYYSDWKKDRSFICERDILENNHPDYSMLGNKLSVHKTINKKLDKLSDETDIDSVTENYLETEEYYKYLDKNLQNIELAEEVVF